MIYLGTDHAGFELKEEIKNYLDQTGVAYEDLGNTKLDENDDYPDYGYQVAKKVSEEENALGIVFCGNAEGICMVANKVKGVRAAIGYNKFAAETSKTDDNANILCLPGRVLTPDYAKTIVKVWLDTKFSEEPRHVDRLTKMQKLEEEGSL